MKKLTVLFVLLIFVNIAYSQTIDQIEGTDISTLDQVEGTDISTLDQFEGSDLPAPAPSGECSSCPQTGANLFCEDFEGSVSIPGDGNQANCSGWTAQTSGTNTVTIGAHSGVFNCTNAGNNAVIFNYEAAQGEYGGISRSLSETDINGEIYFNMVTHTHNNNVYHELINYEAVQRMFAVEIRRHPGGFLRILAGYRNNVGGFTTANIATEFNTGQWKQLRYQFGGGTFNVWLDGVNVYSQSDAQVGTTITLARFGPNAATPTAAGGVSLIHMDIMRADNSTAITNCAGW